MRTRDPNLPIGKLTRVKDILPPPDKLVIPEDTIKVTLRLSKYQRMLRELVDRYTELSHRPS